MDAKNNACPNCGDQLVSHRTDRRPLDGQRAVVLHWFICVRCRHVALNEWLVEERLGPDEVRTSRPRRGDGTPAEIWGRDAGRERSDRRQTDAQVAAGGDKR